MARPLHLGIASALAIAIPGQAWAHPGHDQVPTFFEGLAHPLTGWDHMSLLVASGVAMALSIDPGKALGRREAFGLLSLFTGGVIVMLGSATFGLIVFGLAAAALVGSAASGQSDRQRFARVGAVAAVGLQAASHFLASGDLVTNVEFAAGFALTSIAIFLCSYGLALAMRRRLAARLVRV